MVEKLNHHDKKDYNDSIKYEALADRTKVVNIIKQYLLDKNNIIETLKDTILLPYLLEMEYLIGEYEGMVITDSPMETLKHFKSGNGNAGVTELMNIEMDTTTITKWNVFRYITGITTKFNTTELFTCYLFLRINQSVDYFFFSIYKEKIYTQEITLNFLDKQESIKKIKEVTNDTKEEDPSIL